MPFLALLIVGTAATVAAAMGETTIDVRDIDGTETITLAEAGTLGEVQMGGGTTGGVWPYECFFINDMGAGAVPRPPVVNTLYLMFCNSNDPAIPPIAPTLVLYNPATPMINGVVTAPQIGQIAEAALNIPDFESMVSPEARQITGLETWYWTEGSLAQQPATASLNTLTVTVHADFVETQIDVGEPGVPMLTCPNHAPWARGATSDCVHTYLTEQVGRQITVTNVWRFSQSVNGGPFVPYKDQLYTQVFEVDVVDLEAVISRPGG